MFKFPPERIVCLSEETIETIYLLGEEKRIVGVTGFATRPLNVRKDKPRISTFVSAEIDKILQLKPDLVLAFSDVQAELSGKLILEGLNVFCFNQRDVSGILAMIKTIGALLDCPLKASKLTLSMSTRILELKTRKLKFRPKVYFEEWNTPLISGIRWVSEIIEISGGRDIFSKKSNEAKSKNRIVLSSEVIKKNPDIIVASWCGKKVDIDEIRKREGWNHITAVKLNQVFEMKSSEILQPGPAALIDGISTLSNHISMFVDS